MALAIAGGTAWALWPSSYPASFCKPIVRVVGNDANAFVRYETVRQREILASDKGELDARLYNHPLTARQRDLVEHLVTDARDAERYAPSTRLQDELRRYVTLLGKARTTKEASAALGHFDAVASYQLSGCGVSHVGGRRARS